MAQYTVAYQPQLDGFTSFFSYQPEWAIGMNNYLYTFKSGQIWKHYINPLRNRYYNIGPYSSTVEICFNDSPDEVKLFKTFSYNGNYPDNSVSAGFETILSERKYIGSIGSGMFFKKEGEMYGFIRSENNPAENAFGSTMKEQGVGALYGFNTGALSYKVKATSVITPPTADPTASGYGDLLLFIDSNGIHFKIGLITAYYILNGEMVFYTDAQANTPAIGDTIVISKNTTSESYGIRGSYMTGTITITGTSKVELFSISSDIFKSFP